MKKEQTKMLKKIGKLKAILSSVVEDNQELDKSTQLLCAESSGWLDKEVLFDEEVEFPEDCDCPYCACEITEAEIHPDLLSILEAEADLAERERLFEEKMSEMKKASAIQDKIHETLQKLELSLLEEKKSLEKVAKEVLKITKSVEADIAGNFKEKETPSSY